MYVWYKDAAGNVSSTASDSITLDTTCPDYVTATTASAPPDELEIAKGDTEDVVITVTDDNGCPAAGVKVKKRVSSANNKKVSVSPLSATTDASGLVAFTIKAKKNKGYATVKFKVDGVKVKPKVKVALTK